MRSRHVLPFGLTGLLAALVLVALLVPALPRLAATRAAARPAASAAQTAHLETFEPATVDPSATPAPSGAQARLAQAIAKQQAAGIQVGVAAANTVSGKQVIAGDLRRNVTASIAKLDITAANLLRHQDAKTWVDADEDADIRLAMQRSDNPATDRLLARVGGPTGMDAYHRRLGLQTTTIAPDWIDTVTALEDQIRLLGTTIDPEGPLDERSRAYLYSIMRGVEEGQEWGVGHAGVDPTVKNGWRHSAEDWNIWIVNSIGVTRNEVGQPTLVAVFTRGWTDVQDAKPVMDELAAAALAAVPA